MIDEMALDAMLAEQERQEEDALSDHRPVEASTDGLTDGLAGILASLCMQIEKRGFRLPIEIHVSDQTRSIVRMFTVTTTDWEVTPVRMTVRSGIVTFPLKIIAKDARGRFARQWVRVGFHARPVEFLNT